MVDPGTGADGALVVNANVNLNTTMTAPRTCADAVITRVATLTSNSVAFSAPTAANCYNPGDEVLLISLLGRYDAVDGLRVSNVGNHETLHVQSSTTNGVTFTTNKLHSYGDVTGSDAFTATQQRVFLQRVPNYASVTVNSGGVLTANAWAVTGGGVLFFRSLGPVVVDGSVDMDGKGYNGGGSPNAQNLVGNQGESRAGTIVSYDANLGGRGGGYGGRLCPPESYPGGGGAHFTAGTAGLLMGCVQLSSSPYADFPTKLYLGSGGGGGATARMAATPGGSGGRGGGIIVIHAASIQVNGTVRARGLVGGNATMNGCNPCNTGGAAGGGGAGGTVVLVSAVTNATADVSGGVGGTACAPCSENGGNGGQGVLVIR